MVNYKLIVVNNLKIFDVGTIVGSVKATKKWIDLNGLNRDFTPQFVLDWVNVVQKVVLCKAEGRIVEQKL